MFQSARVLADARPPVARGSVMDAFVSIRARPRGRATMARRVCCLAESVFQSARVLADARPFISHRVAALGGFQSARVLADARLCVG